MNDVTQILNNMRSGEAQSREQLLPAVYEELRRMARAKMSNEAGGHTLQPTALVHEAWLRMTSSSQQTWENRRHFFGAAAESMRRILVDHARRKQSLKRGAQFKMVELDASHIEFAVPEEELLSVHDALDKLARVDAPAAELVKLRYFIGMTMNEAAEAMGMSKRSAEGIWTFARAWLHREIRRSEKTR